MNSLHTDVKSKIEEMKVTEPERAIQNVKDAFGRKSLVTCFFYDQSMQTLQCHKRNDEILQQFANRLEKHLKPT
jgi:hypothetical protein